MVTCEEKKDTRRTSESTNQGGISSALGTRLQRDQLLIDFYNLRKVTRLIEIKGQAVKQFAFSQVDP
jgi:hypothetical protein